MLVYRVPVMSLYALYIPCWKHVSWITLTSLHLYVGYIAAIIELLKIITSKLRLRLLMLV